MGRCTDAYTTINNTQEISQEYWLLTQAPLGLLGQSYNKNLFSSGPFWTHKIKTKAKYISISSILHLLSAPASIPIAGAISASLVVESLSYCKFIFASNFCLIVDSHFHPSRALTRSFEVFTPTIWTYICYINQSQVLHMHLSCS